MNVNSIVKMARNYHLRGRRFRMTLQVLKAQMRETGQKPVRKKITVNVKKVQFHNKSLTPYTRYYFL